MTEFLQDFGFMVCTSAIVVGIFSALVPNKALGKTVRTILGIYMAVIIVYPFVNGSIDFSIESAMQNQQSYLPEELDLDNYNELLTHEIKSSLENSIVELLNKQLSVAVNSVSAEINIDEKGSIYCDRVTIDMDEKYGEHKSEVSTLVKQTCAVEPSFI